MGSIWFDTRAALGGNRDVSALAVPPLGHARRPVHTFRPATPMRSKRRLVGILTEGVAEYAFVLSERTTRKACVLVPDLIDFSGDHICYRLPVRSYGCCSIMVNSSSAKGESRHADILAPAMRW